ncbi:protein hunchback-like [Culex pipiens pallens]|uniref:protein hunchback-like n=1 Tax=Culex pipiens pallens TaxID=42434 RepID=UPI0019539B09|nr:protein hunchback-like [Culex pipiens pallens]
MDSSFSSLCRAMQNFDSIMSGAAIPQQTSGSWMDMPIKAEPLDASSSYQQHYGHHYQSHLQHHQQDTPMSHSSPTSPQSVDSMDSINGGRTQYYESKSSGMLHGYNPLGFNPLTPPGYAGMFVPTQQQNQLQRQTTPNRSYGKQDSGYVSSTLTPTHTPPMDVTPPKSPKDIVETPKKDDDNNSSDCEGSYDGSDDEEGIRKPKINSHGKVKKFKCKQCEFIAVTKLSFWEHTRSHIKPEKMLNCPKCPFVTEYKHHLEYHMRNHDRSKPFQCPKCSYSCVNKSMLNSHMKSHSNVFQYRCADCNYATKYCHSLKLHLRKYAHKPDIVLNMDGTPNPLPIIDVYGTRRGPKTKSQKLADQKPQESQQQPQQAPLTPQSHPQTPQTQLPFTPPSSQPNNLQRNLLPHQLLPNPLAHMFKNANNLPLFPYLNLNFQMFADQQAAINQLSPNFHQFHDKQEQSSSPTKNPAPSSSTLSEELLKRITAAAADSSDFKPDVPSDEMDHQTTAEDLSTPAIETPLTPSTSIRSAAPVGSTGKNRRKGRAFKLERLESSSPATMEHSDDEHDEPKQPSPVKEAKEAALPVEACVTPQPPAAAPEMRFRCSYCEIGFEHEVMYTIHMGWHGYDDVFKCNMCGEKCEDRISFQLHMVRKAHPK